MFFSFVIPHRESESPQKLISTILHSTVDFDYEIFTVTGNNPTLQRNECAKLAQGQFLYFLDCDSHIDINSLTIASNLLKEKPEIDILGGPSITPPTDNYFQLSISQILGNSLAVGKICERYRSIGNLRTCDDKSLILCNMIVKKNTFVQFNGFNELLYPNEENQFIKRVKKSEGKVYYHPEIKVFRSQRPDIKSYIKQMYTYGLGRGEQIKLEKKIESSFLIPLLFSLWVMVGVIPTLFFSIFDMLQTSISNIFIDSFILLNQSLMAVYNFLLLISWLNALSFSKHFSILFPFLFFICHFFYGIGIYKSIFKKKYRVENKKNYFKIKRY